MSLRKKLHITGGIGGGNGEGFSGEYDLPNLQAYNETCSSIANILWQQRMFQRKRPKFVPPPAGRRDVC
jgi:DUF1680 family protein